MSDASDFRRSIIVNLTMLGLMGVGMAYLPEGKTVRRNMYRDRETCERDYSPAQCEPGDDGGSGGGSTSGHGRWRGPEYYEDRRLPEASGDPGPGRAGLSSGVELSTRGGFGRTGHGGRAGG